MTDILKVNANVGPSNIELRDNKSVMMIGNNGVIKFNREDYPNLTEDDFAKKTAEILETEPCPDYGYVVMDMWWTKSFGALPPSKPSRLRLSRKNSYQTI